MDPEHSTPPPPSNRSLELRSATGDERIECTLVLTSLRKAAHEAEILGILGREPDTDSSFYEDLRCVLTALPVDLETLRTYVEERGLEVVSTCELPGSMVIAGTARALHETFAQPVPGLEGSLLAIHGLDEHPSKSRCTPQLIVGGIRGRHELVTVPKLAEHYSFPGLTGAGHKLAVLILGGGFDGSGLDTYFGCLGLPVPCWTVHSVDGASNEPTKVEEIEALLLKAGAGTKGPPAACHPTCARWPELEGLVAFSENSASLALSWTAEALMDIEYLGALANGAELAIYVAPNDARGIRAAICRAADDGMTALSCSFSAVEDDYTPAGRAMVEQALQYAALRRMTTCFSSGNDGSTPRPDRGLAVGYPASSPWTLGCGGTRIESWTTVDPSNEVVWNEQVFGQRMASGGGFSDRFRAPPWQKDRDVRGVPDVASNAAQASGCWIWYGDGQTCGVNTIGGGTSAAAPLWAALTVLLSQGLGRRLGFWSRRLYGDELRGGFQPITKGNNIVTHEERHYHASPGWNPCCGLGRPNGRALLEALAGLPLR